MCGVRSVSKGERRGNLEIKCADISQMFIKLWSAILYIFRRRLYLDPLASSGLYVEAHNWVGFGKEICVSQVVAGDVQLHS